MSTTTHQQAAGGHTVEGLSAELHENGITVVRGAFAPEWAVELDTDLSREFSLALRTPGGVAARGWNRFYFEPFPERVRGFWDLASHPLVQELAEHLFGPQWQVVELGTDIPLPGAVNQPWHRDFPMPAATRDERRLTSFAINASTVDVVEGPFQAVLGTQFEDGTDYEGGMFPAEGTTADYESRMQSFYAKAGNFSIRSGLMLHRGSAMSTAARMRPVAILGVVSPDDRAVVDRLKDPSDPHPPRLRLSREAFERVDPALLPHLSVEVICETADDLPPYSTAHSFEGLKMDERKA
ncbi:MAG: Phytanoyl-CoA dioxygenase [Actinotalea sp.]|nr:Phytanoyl-CoA dioxygenase [Actinotalea sp.]